MSRVSFEQFADETGRVIDISQFKRRRVEAVGTFEDADGEKPVWTIIFAGGAKLHNYDPTIPPPAHVVGSEMTMVILGAHHGETGAAQTELRFGLNPIYLNPLEYAMEDDKITDGRVVFPQRSRANL